MRRPCPCWRRRGLLYAVDSVPSRISLLNSPKVIISFSPFLFLRDRLEVYFIRPTSQRGQNGHIPLALQGPVPNKPVRIPMIRVCKRRLHECITRRCMRTAQSARAQTHCRHPHACAPRRSPVHKVAQAHTDDSMCMGVLCTNRCMLHRCFGSGRPPPPPSPWPSACTAPSPPLPESEATNSRADREPAA